ncbi:MAG TPA: lanthionine synthetase LanC family protein [Gemmatimonadales bacterium]|nr:lanthionine synthetase LanC family protein [Gemmatimonadales bacterium]
MALTDLLVLPDDVLLRPLAELPSALRRRLPAVPRGYAVGRARVRASSKVVGRDAALLLQRFRSPTRIVDALIAERGAGDARQALGEAFPLLRSCYEARILVPAHSPDAARIAPSFDKGERIADYVIIRSVMVLEDSELYQVRNAQGQVSAVKIARAGAEERLRAAMRQECRALQLLRGRDAPSLRESGTVEGRPWLAMSWRTGVSPLVRAAEFRSQGREGQASLLRLLVSVTRAYARLHSRLVLHGDVHAGNLLVDPTGRITILDYGLSRVGGRRERERGAVLPYAEPLLADAWLRGGTPPPLSAAGEQFAIAALLYHLASGATHVGPMQDRDVMLRALATRPPLAFSAQGAVPWPELEAVLARALAQGARERFPSVRALADALEHCPLPPVSHSPAIPPRSRTDAWLRTLERHSPPEWARRLGPPRCSVMHGMAGTAFGLYRLAVLRDDPRLLSQAAGWCEVAKLAAARHGAFLNPRQGLDATVAGTVAPLFTASGLLLVDAHVAQATGQDSRMAALIEQYCALPVAGEARIELGQGIGGVLLGAVQLLECAPPELMTARRHLWQLGRTLAQRLDASLSALDHFPAGPGPLQNAGIVHGWGGVLYALLRWCRVAGTDPTPALARALTALARLAEPRGSGVQFPHVSGTGSHHDIPGWCNGPAGLVHLWILAAQLTGQRRYEALAQRCGWSAWEAPDLMPDLCCGLAGRSYALLALYRATGDGAWLDRARRLQQRTARTFPRGASGMLSLYKGALGAALLDQELALPARSCHPLFESEGWPLSRSGA